MRFSVIAAVAVAQAHGLRVLPGATHPSAASRCASPAAGLFDNLFKESDAQKQAKEEQYQEMQRMQQLRRDPAAFDKEISKRRTEELARRAAEVGNLPDGWKMAQDPTSGDTYYYNKELQITQWEPPLEEMVNILEENQ